MKCPHCNKEFKVLKKEHPTKTKITCGTWMDCRNEPCTVFDFTIGGVPRLYFAKCERCAFKQYSNDEPDEFMFHKYITKNPLCGHLFVYIPEGIGHGDVKYVCKAIQEMFDPIYTTRYCEKCKKLRRHYYTKNDCICNICKSSNPEHKWVKVDDYETHN